MAIHVDVVIELLLFGPLRKGQRRELATGVLLMQERKENQKNQKNQKDKGKVQKVRFGVEREWKGGKMVKKWGKNGQKVTKNGEKP